VKKLVDLFLVDSATPILVNIFEGHRNLAWSHASNLYILYVFICIRYFEESQSVVSFTDQPETHIKRQATKHGCLPSLLGDEDKGIQKVYIEEKIFCTGLARATKADKKSLVLSRQAQQTNQGRTPLLFILT
jgi:hypothetical protein